MYGSPSDDGSYLRNGKLRVMSQKVSSETSTESKLDQGSFNDPTSTLLDGFMKNGWGPQRFFESPPSPPPSHLERRRRQLEEALPNDMAVVCAGQPVRRCGDQFYRFRAESDYVWLTGDQMPGGVLVMTPGADPALFLQPPSDRGNGEFWKDALTGELWVGRRPSLDQRSEELGIECRPLSELSTSFNGPSRVRHLPDVDTSVIAELRNRDDVANRELRAVLSELRLAKDDWEIQQLRIAVDATIRGFADVGRLLRSGESLTERNVEVTFDARARLEGYSTGYQTISAVGEHAATLHWSRNDGGITAGQLLLLDAGVEINSLYTADITRTIPVGGRFSALQRQVYEIVLAAQEAAFKMVRPGERFKAFYSESARVLAEGLADLGVLPVGAGESLQPDSGLHRRWTLCSPGHMLGLDVHDCGSARAPEYLEGVLKPGQVLTVEPGLYFQANDETIPEELRGQGFRIEDDLLVTSDGFELLSAALPRSVSDIEAWLSSPGDL
jgi:Xaa-Pro aminopeptidase